MEPMLPNFIDPQLLEVPPMAEIIGIDGVKKLNNGADTEVIAYLEALLSRAKRAEITGAAIVVTLPNGGISTGWAHDTSPNPHLLVSGCEFLKRDLMESIEAHSKD